MARRGGRWTALAGAALLAVGLSGCIGGPDGPRPEARTVPAAEPDAAAGAGNVIGTGSVKLALIVPLTGPGASVGAALRNAANKRTRIVTLDLSEPLALDMVKGGNVAAIVADEAYQIGVTAARAAAAGLIGEKTAPFLAVDALALTKAGLAEGWRRSLHDAPPASLATP